MKAVMRNLNKIQQKKMKKMQKNQKMRNKFEILLFLNCFH